MKQTRLLMGMPITVDVKDLNAKEQDINEVYLYFNYIDEKFSTYKPKSEISLINKNKIRKSEMSNDMKEIFDLSEKTKKETDGYFDIKINGKIDPSGIVKGWAIKKAADILRKKGFKRFYVDAGGDSEIVGKNWKWGIRNPFNTKGIIKVLKLSNCGIATSGTYERGQHIYDPKTSKKVVTDIVSLSVIGSNIYEADRFATAAFAMGNKAIAFIESLSGFEGYMINSTGIATETSGFGKYTK